MNGNFGGGNGTEHSPYLVEDAQDLNAIRNNPYAYYLQIADIDLSIYTSFEPIGSGTTGPPFGGSYDGGEYKITGLKINTVPASIKYTGIFSFGNGATFRNIHIVGAHVDVESSTYDSNSILVGQAIQCSIENCSIKSSSITSTNNTGMLAGFAAYTTATECTIEDCYVDTTGTNTGGCFGNIVSSNIINCTVLETTITGGEFTGGMVGFTANSDFSDCLVRDVEISGVVYVGGMAGKGDGGCLFDTCSVVDGSVNYLVHSMRYGGFAGELSACTLIHCATDTTVKGASAQIGGFAGYIVSCTLTECMSLGSIIIDVSGVSIGGFVGEVVGSSSLTGCYTKSSVFSSDTPHLGGFVGNAYGDPTFTDCYSTGDVSGGTKIGGFAGRLSEVNAINCYSIGSVMSNKVGSAYTGGFVGEVIGATEITQCYSKGNIEGSANTGGFVGGVKEGGFLLDCFFEGSVIGNSSSVGGFAGLVESGSTIKGSHVTGSVTSNDWQVGGFVGLVAGGSTLYMCYTEGGVSGQGDAGGFVGYCSQGSTIEQCYSIGDTISDYNVGGFAGKAGIESTIKQCYAIGKVSGAGHVAGFVGRIYGLLTILESYCVSEVVSEDPDNVGAFAFPLDDSVLMAERCYYNHDLTGALCDFDIATPKSTKSMRNKETFVDWDFRDVWRIWDLWNDGYPCFKYREYGGFEPYDPIALPLVWETPYNDLGSPDIRKQSTYFYCTLQGQGLLKVDAIFDDKEKSIIIKCPEEPTVIRRRIRNRGRRFKLRFSNVNGSKFTLKNPVLVLDLDSD